MNFITNPINLLLNLFSKSKKKRIIILTKRKTLFMARMYQQNLAELGFETKIISGRRKKFTRDLHLVLYPHIFPVLPENWIAVQLEQSTSPWFTPQYIENLKKAEFILDCTQVNVDFLISKGVSKDKLFIIPMSAVELKKFSKTKKYDVLFYGASNPRREQWLEKLSQNFKVNIITSAYDEDLYKQMAEAKVIANIHFYEDAVLEATRLLECISAKALVVSEEGIDQEKHEALNGIVHFVKIDDLDGMVERIKQVISEGASFNQNAADRYVKDINDKTVSALKYAFQTQGLLDAN